MDQFAQFRGNKRLEFYTDSQLIEDFKSVIEKVMSSFNPFTGFKYKVDPTILGWETGNELMTSSDWMSNIVALPHYYKNITDEALNDPHIDVVKSHYYEGNFANRVMKY